MRGGVFKGLYFIRAIASSKYFTASLAFECSFSMPRSLSLMISALRHQKLKSFLALY